MPRGPAEPLRRGMKAAGQLDTLPQLKRGLGSPGAVRDRPGLHRRVDLLRRRRRRREGARAHVGGVPRRRGVLRRARAELRRGRVAAPGARRRDGDRPLRVQRAVELRGGLGDPARLPDPDRADRVLDHRLRGGVLRAVRLRHAGVPARGGGRDRRRDRQRARQLPAALRARLADRARRPGAAAAGGGVRDVPRVRAGGADGPGLDRGLAVAGGPRVRVPARARRLQRHRRLVRARRPGRDRPPRAAAADRRAADRGLRAVRRDRARRLRGAADAARQRLGGGADGRRRRRVRRRRGSASRCATRWRSRAC